MDKVKTKTATKAADAKIALAKEQVRKSLYTLQATATDKENLVGGGRTLRSAAAKDPVKDAMSEKSKLELEKVNKEDDKSKRKKPVAKAKSKEKINEGDLTSEAGPSENYWQHLAENLERRLEAKIEENEELKDENRRQSQQIVKLQARLDEATNIIRIFEEMMGEESDDVNNSLEDTL